MPFPAPTCSRLVSASLSSLASIRLVRRQLDAAREAALWRAFVDRQAALGPQVVFGGPLLAWTDDLPPPLEPASAVVVEDRADRRRRLSLANRRHRVVLQERDLHVGDGERHSRAASRKAAGDGHELVGPAGPALEAAHVEEGRRLPALGVLVGAPRHRRRDRPDVGEGRGAVEPRLIEARGELAEDRRRIALETDVRLGRDDRATPDAFGRRLLA